MRAPELRTERLRMRHWREGDLAPFAAMNADPEVMEFFPAPLSCAESDALVARAQRGLAERGFGLWALEEMATSRFIGFAGLAVPGFAAHFTPAVEVGWRLVRSAWGHGYATEAGRAALAYALNELGLPEVVSFTSAGNLRSRRVMQRLGMTHDAADDFDHPELPLYSSLSRHVLYRASR